MTESAKGAPEDLSEWDKSGSPSSWLHRELRQRIRKDSAGCRTGDVLSASALHRKTKINRQTCTRVLNRLAEDGYLRKAHRLGFQVVSAIDSPTSETLLSMTQFASDNPINFVSVLDDKSFRVRPVSELKRRKQLIKHLGLKDDDDVLVVRRVRGFRRPPADDIHWALLDTAYVRLVDELEHFESRIRALSVFKLSQMGGDQEPTGNFSLHALFGEFGLTLTKSAYFLPLGPPSKLKVDGDWEEDHSLTKNVGLSGGEADAWEKIGADYPKDEYFFTLRSTTYVEGNRPIAYSISHIVPGYFNINMTRFQLSLREQLDTVPIGKPDSDSESTQGAEVSAQAGEGS